MKLVSTRDLGITASPAEAIVSGIAPDGGLYVPEEFPVFTKEEITGLTEKSYEERAAFVLSRFLTDFTEEELLAAAKDAYAKFTGDAAPLVKIDEATYVLELFHGPTCAFKDIALTLLPRLLALAKQKLGVKEKTEILVATSGDTGKAALEGFKDVPGTGIIVFYPSEGVSDVQKLQMSTQEGENVFVAGVDGNFDDCQTAVKRIFADKEVEEALAKEGVRLSSANSINFGRLVPQVAYYFSAYADLLESGEISYGDPVNFCVPTGNFGNILAGYYAKRCGLPVGKLICASNSNNILTDFFRTGAYDMRRKFHKTMSPSMDILISSNLERLLFEFLGRDASAVAALMADLKGEGQYCVEKRTALELSQLFYAGFATEEETRASIADFFKEYGYPLDPHTAVAAAVYNEYVVNAEDETKTVLVATASPYKFAADVLAAISGKAEPDAFQAVRKLYAETAVEVPENIERLAEKEPRFTQAYPREGLAEIVKREAVKKWE